MQPKFRFNKTLLAGALVLGLGNAFHANSETFTVTASSIPDLTITTVAGSPTTLSFGNRILPTPANGSTCSIGATSFLSESDLGFQLNGDTTDDDLSTVEPTGILDAPGALFGTGCIQDLTGGSASGSHMIIDVDAGTAEAGVSISIPPVVGTGWTFTAGNESCYTDFDGATGADDCVRFGTNNDITGIQTSDVYANETPATGTANIDDDPEGKIRIVLGGTLTFDGTPITGPVADSIVVSVVYE